MVAPTGSPQALEGATPWGTTAEGRLAGRGRLAELGIMGEWASGRGKRARDGLAGIDWQVDDGRGRCRGRCVACEAGKRYFGTGWPLELH